MCSAEAPLELRLVNEMEHGGETKTGQELLLLGVQMWSVTLSLKNEQKKRSFDLSWFGIKMGIRTAGQVRPGLSDKNQATEALKQDGKPTPATDSMNFLLDQKVKAMTNLWSSSKFTMPVPPWLNETKPMNMWIALIQSPVLIHPQALKPWVARSGVSPCRCGASPAGELVWEKLVFQFHRLFLNGLSLEPIVNCLLWSSHIWQQGTWYTLVKLKGKKGVLKLQNSKATQIWQAHRTVYRVPAYFNKGYFKAFTTNKWVTLDVFVWGEGEI